MKKETQTQIQFISNWIARLSYEDIPQDVILYAKLHFLDCISAICAGSRTDIGVRLKEALKGSESGGPCTLLPDGENWSLDNVLFYNSAMINALELDNFIYMGHVGQSVISSSLAMGQKLDATGKELLLSMVTATEVAGRLGANLVNGPQQGHMRAFIHRVGSATATAKISKYDESVIAQALAISLSMPEYPLYPACFSPDTKVICTSSPTVAGVKAALMAAHGISGPLDIIENPAGFYINFSSAKFIPDIWRWIGVSWTLRSLSIKKYASCGYAQGSVNAAIRLKANHTFQTDEISRINIYVPIVTLIMEKFSKPHYQAGITPVNTNFSTVRSVAAALIFGELTGDFYRAGTFEDKVVEIQKLHDRIFLHHDWKMTIQSMRGIDAGLANPGKPGFMSLGSTNKTFKQFKKAFGSRKLLQWKDILELSKIPWVDLRYFISRYFKSIRFPLFNNRTHPNATANYSHEGELDKMQFHISGRVEIILTNGMTISETCQLPPGFANDPERETVVQDKFMREAKPVWGEVKSRRIMEMILNIENYTVTQLCAEINSCTS